MPADLRRSRLLNAGTRAGQRPLHSASCRKNLVSNAYGMTEISIFFLLRTFSRCTEKKYSEVTTVGRSPLGLASESLRRGCLRPSLHKGAPMRGNYTAPSHVSQIAASRDFPLRSLLTGRRRGQRPGSDGRAEKRLDARLSARLRSCGSWVRRPSRTSVLSLRCGRQPSPASGCASHTRACCTPNSESPPKLRTKARAVG